MKSFSTTIEIQSSPETVWAILTNGAAWTNWNSTIDKVEGTIAPGEKITVFSKVSPGRAFPLKVSEYVPGQRMVWSGGMPLGLFKGQRTYTLTPKGKGVEFGIREEFSGLMAPLITKSIPDLQPSFETFAADLKRRAERTET
jgi:hypothetical protein